mgnify:CR=1 FL=1
MNMRKYLVQFSTMHLLVIKGIEDYMLPCLNKKFFGNEFVASISTNNFSCVYEVSGF